MTRRVFNGSGDRQAVEIIDISDPTQPATVGGIDVNAYGDEPQAVAIHKGILAVTVVTHDRPEIPGAILLFNVDGIPPGRSRSCARRPPATSPAPCSTSTAACT